MKMKVWTIFTNEVELTESDVTFVLLIAEVNNWEGDFQRLLDEAMMYLHNTSIAFDMDYEEIQEWWFEKHKDIVKTLCF